MEQFNKVMAGLIFRSLHHPIDIGIGLYLGGIKIQLFSPNKTSINTLLNDFLEK
jgi:hypothetical protein